jgi:LysR family glycine cleavage system transcriptional activator
MQILHLPQRRKMKRLPPIAALEAFVQTARTGSVKAAAAALALSAPALSRRLQTLERHLGRPLFERRHQAMRLNPDGERLLAEVAPAIDGLARALARAAGVEERLHISMMPLFASSEVLPRLPSLRAAHPELHIDIDTAPHALSRLDDGLDAAIVLARDIDPALYSRRLGTSRVVAIGARSLAEGPQAIRQPADIARATILLHRDLPDAFETWRDAVGHPDLEPAAIDYFDSGQLILDAAAAGLGVAFMMEMHLDGSGDPRLCQLIEESAETPYHYFFACRRVAMARRTVRVFHDWLVDALESVNGLAVAA